MSWRKAMIVETAIAKKIETEKGIGRGTVFSDEEPVCVVGVGLDALGIKANDYNNVWNGGIPDTCLKLAAADMAVAFGCTEENIPAFSAVLREVVSHNDGIHFGNDEDRLKQDYYKQNQPLAAELLVAGVKEFVPDDDE